MVQHPFDRSRSIHKDFQHNRHCSDTGASSCTVAVFAFRRVVPKPPASHEHVHHDVGTHLSPTLALGDDPEPLAVHSHRHHVVMCPCVSCWDVPFFVAAFETVDFARTSQDHPSVHVSDFTLSCVCSPASLFCECVSLVIPASAVHTVCCSLVPWFVKGLRCSLAVVMALHEPLAIVMALHESLAMALHGFPASLSTC